MGHVPQVNERETDLNRAESCKDSSTDGSLGRQRLEKLKKLGLSFKGIDLILTIVTPPRASRRSMMKKER